MTRARSGALPPVRKSLGQHFLTDRSILGRIADALGDIAGLTVLEIGPGRGALTEILLEHGARVVAVEYDRMLAQYLARRFAGNDHLRVVQADVLDTNLAELAGGEFRVVGNVPYYITTPILFHALAPPRPRVAVYLIQREVAERMSATAGDREYGALTANVQAVAGVETLFKVPARAFSPPPRVESAVVRLMPLESPVISRSEEGPYRELVQGVFGFRRKQMRRVLRELRDMTADEADALLREIGIDPEARPETLGPAAFAALLSVLPSA